MVGFAVVKKCSMFESLHSLACSSCPYQGGMLCAFRLSSHLEYVRQYAAIDPMQKSKARSGVEVLLFGERKIKVLGSPNGVCITSTVDSPRKPDAVECGTEDVGSADTDLSSPS